MINVELKAYLQGPWLCSKCGKKLAGETNGITCTNQGINKQVIEATYLRLTAICQGCMNKEVKESQIEFFSMSSNRGRFFFISPIMDFTWGINETQSTAFNKKLHVNSGIDAMLLTEEGQGIRLSTSNK